MDKDFWHDLYPTSETRRRLFRATILRIYLPIGVAALIAIGIGAAAFATARGGDPAHPAQLAILVLAAGLLAAGFVAWLIILESIWRIENVMRRLPEFTGWMRLHFILGARSWKRGANTVKRSADSVLRLFSQRAHGSGWAPLRRRYGRRADPDE
ncbi:MAG: hypothetical protein JW929_07725 [Anaerolineales bacterium]|nr:hypothetical protein [Anaerolineales bacterium]